MVKMMTKINDDDKKYLREMRESEYAENEILELKLQIIRDELEKTLLPQIQAKNAITKRNAQRRLELENSRQKNY